MKNIFKIFIVLLSFSAFSQNEADLPDGVGLPNGTIITTTTTTDKVAVFDVDNNSNRLILIDDLLKDYEGYFETGTRAGGDLKVIIGDYDDSNEGTKIILDDGFNPVQSINFEIAGDNPFTVLADQLIIRNSFPLTFLNASNSLGSSFLNLDNITANRDYYLPDNTGYLALSVNNVFADNQGNITLPTFPAPYTQFSHVINQNTTEDVVINGSFFTSSTTVSIAGQTVNSVTFISDNELIVNVTSGTVNGFYDVIIDNGTATTIASSFEVVLSVWLDLRAGGDAFTDGNAAGNDIRYRAGMSMSRDVNGMFFNGSNPWSSWVKFESEAWTRGDNKTIQWILTSPTAAMMIGIGSDATNETATDQYRQSEINAYFQNANTLWGLYGNNGTVGVAGNQALSTSIAGQTVFKIKFENDGGAGSIFTLYALPSSNPSDWDDESTVLRTATVGGSLNPDETNLMPFIIPRTGTQRFIALKVD